MQENFPTICRGGGPACRKIKKFSQKHDSAPKGALFFLNIAARLGQKIDLYDK